MPKAPLRKTGVIVLSAIKKLMRNTGWTSRTIIKFIRLEYRITDNHISSKVRRALKRGVKLGVLQLERGRYRLNEMSRLAKPVTAQEIRKHQNQHYKNSRDTRHYEAPLRMDSPEPL